MNQYKVEVNVITKWFLDVPGETEEDAKDKAENLDLDEIEASGDFGEVTNVEVTDIEQAYREDTDGD